MHVTKELVIASPADKVFQFIADPERSPLYVPNLAEVNDVSPQAPGVGQSWRYEFSMLGVPLRGASECTVFEPSSRYGFRSGGMIPSEWLYTLSAEEGGTRVRVDIEYQPPDSVIAKVANIGLLTRLNENETERGIQSLKIILED